MPPILQLTSPFGEEQTCEPGVAAESELCKLWAGCEAEGGGKLPGVAPLLKSFGRLPSLRCDYLHPGAQGYRVVAKAVRDAITSALDGGTDTDTDVR